MTRKLLVLGSLLACLFAFAESSIHLPAPIFTGPVIYTTGGNSYTLSPGWPASGVTCTTSGTVNFNTLARATIELDLTASDMCTPTITGVVAGGAYVIKVHGAAGATVSWPGTFDWGNAGAPTISTSGYDDVHLLVQQSTSNIHAYVGGQGFSH